MRRLDPDDPVPNDPPPARPPPARPAPPAPTDPDAPIATGTGWKQYKLSGVFRDADSGVESNLVDQDVVITRGSTGIASAPLSDAAKTALKADLQIAMAAANGLTESDMVYVVHRTSANQLGTPSPSGAGAHSACDDYYKDYTADKDYSESYALDKPFNEGAFVGNFKLNASSYGGAAATLRMKVKRGSVLGVCLPYAIGFVNVRVRGSATAVADVDANGSFKQQGAYVKTLAKPSLGSFAFSIGPVPVRIGFNLPIEAGIKSDGYIAAQVKGQAMARGSFDYTCTTRNCSGSKSFDAGFTSAGEPSGFVSGRVKVQAWAQAALRVYLYTDELLYGQVGLRPTVDLDFNGYAGNTCGDGNGDGVEEWVAGTTMDSVFHLDLTGKAYAFGLEWDTSDELYRRRISFLKSGGDNPPWSPMLRVTSTDGSTATILAGSRPCWPYTDALNYEFQFGDGTTDSGTRPAGMQSFTHTYPGKGLYPISYSLVSDANGRSIGSTVSGRVWLSPESGSLPGGGPIDIGP
jgi:hypothetical protein